MEFPNQKDVDVSALGEKALESVSSECIGGGILYVTEMDIKEKAFMFHEETMVELACFTKSTFDARWFSRAWSICIIPVPSWRPLRHHTLPS